MDESRDVVDPSTVDEDGGAEQPTQTSPKASTGIQKRGANRGGRGFGFPGRILSVLEDFVPAALLAFMTGAVVVDVTMRYVLSRPLRGTAEMATAAFVWVVFISGAAAARTRVHVRVELFDRWLSATARLVMDSVATVLTAAIAAILAFLGYKLYQASGARTMPLLNLPFRYVTLAAPVGFAIIAGHSLVNLLENIRALASRDPDAASKLLESRVESGQL